MPPRAVGHKGFVHYGGKRVMNRLKFTNQGPSQDNSNSNAALGEHSSLNGVSKSPWGGNTRNRRQAGNVQKEKSQQNANDDQNQPNTHQKDIEYNHSDRPADYEEVQLYIGEQQQQQDEGSSVVGGSVSEGENQSVSNGDLNFGLFTASDNGDDDDEREYMEIMNEVAGSEMGRRYRERTNARLAQLQLQQHQHPHDHLRLQHTRGINYRERSGEGQHSRIGHRHEHVHHHGHEHHTRHSAHRRRQVHTCNHHRHGTLVHRHSSNTQSHHRCSHSAGAGFERQIGDIRGYTTSEPTLQCQTQQEEDTASWSTITPHPLSDIDISSHPAFLEISRENYVTDLQLRSAREELVRLQAVLRARPPGDDETRSDKNSDSIVDMRKGVQDILIAQLQQQVHERVQETTKLKLQLDLANAAAARVRRNCNRPGEHCSHSPDVEGLMNKIEKLEKENRSLGAYIFGGNTELNRLCRTYYKKEIVDLQKNLQEWEKTCNLMAEEVKLVYIKLAGAKRVLMDNGFPVRDFQIFPEPDAVLTEEEARVALQHSPALLQIAWEIEHSGSIRDQLQAENTNASTRRNMATGNSGVLGTRTVSSNSQSQGQSQQTPIIHYNRVPTLGNNLANLNICTGSSNTPALGPPPNYHVPRVEAKDKSEEQKALFNRVNGISNAWSLV